MKNSLLKFGYTPSSPLFIMAAVFAVIIFKPFICLATFSTEKEDVAGKQYVEILTQNNNSEAEDDGSEEDATLDQQAKDAGERKDKGASGELGTPSEEDTEDDRNGPDDPE
ncbi:MAG: hypothetical protein ACKOW3_03235 [Hyphomicrobium sp.]